VHCFYGRVDFWKSLFSDTSTKWEVEDVKRVGPAGWMMTPSQAGAPHGGNRDVKGPGPLPVTSDRLVLGTVIGTGVLAPLYRKGKVRGDLCRLPRATEEKPPKTRIRTSFYLITFLNICVRLHDIKSYKSNTKFTVSVCSKFHCLQWLAL
jgi:hypothetical protein